MPYRQRVAFISALLLLGVGYLYAYVPAHYVAEDAVLYDDMFVDASDTFEDAAEEAVVIFSPNDSENASVDELTASALDVLSGE